MYFRFNLFDGDRPSLPCILVTVRDRMPCFLCPLFALCPPQLLRSTLRLANSRSRCTLRRDPFVMAAACLTLWRKFVVETMTQLQHKRTSNNPRQGLRILIATSSRFHLRPTGLLGGAESRGAPAGSSNHPCLPMHKISCRYTIELSFHSNHISSHQTLYRFTYLRSQPPGGSPD